MEYSTRVTDSGIVRCDAFGDTFKMNSLTLNFFWSLDKQYASKIALLCGVLKRGNTVFGEMDKISAYLDMNYGANLDISTSKAGELQLLSFTAAYIDNKFALDGEDISANMVKLLDAVIFSPILENGVFKESYVTQEKQNLKDRILALINDKQVYSYEKCKRIMFANEKYGVYEQGDIDEIEKITPASLYEFYLELLDKAMLVVSYGGIKCDTDALTLPLMQKLSGGNREKLSTYRNENVDKVNKVTEEMDVAQSKLNMGFRLGESAASDLFALRMFNVIFGGSPTSKLFMNVRERLSLCYYCSGVCDVLKNVMFVYSGVETKNAEIAEREILNQLSLMQKGEFTEEEFNNARAYLADSYIQAGDSSYALSNLLVSAYIQGHNLTPDEQIRELEKVTPERVKAVASDIKLDTVFLLKGMGGVSDAE
ncbi:MAG: insulinase family protein [Clostridia bacterium]|nr:insulinase family protein [Clostridia bacterium]